MYARRLGADNIVVLTMPKKKGRKIKHILYDSVTFVLSVTAKRIITGKTPSLCVKGCCDERASKDNTPKINP